MIDMTKIIPLEMLSAKNINKTVYTDGLIQQNKLVEPPEYISSNSRFRLTIHIDDSKVDSSLRDSAYILAKGTLKTNQENPSYDDLTLVLEDCTIFETDEIENGLSVTKTASVFEEIFKEYGTGAGLPKRFVIEQAKHQDASYDTAIETINRLVTDGRMFEPKTGFISSL
jgi:hypothetical protein